MLVCVVAAAVFWRTAYPTITWWDSSSYSLAARTLAIAGQPGSLLLTLIGWPVARLPVGSSPAHLLNLLAGVLAALAATLVFLVALELRRTAARSDKRAIAGRGVAIGAGLGALTFAFSDTLWDYATRFTPYVLTPVVTGLILWTMLRWWREADQPDAWRWIALLGLLFGLDFSVHRTNALLVPGALVWILIRRPRTLATPRAVLGGAGGLLAGLAVQLLVIPIAMFTRSPLDFVVPSTWARFWDYITLKDLGGGFLLSVFPRKSNIWSVQTIDVLRTLAANFAPWTGPASVLRVLPALAAVLGLVVLWRGNRRLAMAFAVVILLQFAATVLYFNTPADYFRSFDRHYLPLCVPIAMLVACGLSALVEQADRLPRIPWRVAAITLAALVPAAQLAGNWSRRDASNRWFARDYAANALEGLPPNAVYFTVGDNDTFPLMYLQGVEGVRPDVAILNQSVANIAEYEQRRHRRDPSFPVTLTTAERRALIARPWTDTALVLPVVGTAEQLGLAAGTPLPASVAFTVRPTNGSHMLAAELTIFDIVRTNRWRRPLTFAITGTRSAMMWLAPYGRLDGLFWRVVPQRDPPPNLDRLRSRLLDSTRYRGYDDPTVVLDDFARNIGFQYYAAAIELLQAESARGFADRCRADMQAFVKRIQPDRLQMPAEYREQFNSACNPKR